MRLSRESGMNNLKLRHTGGSRYPDFVPAKAGNQKKCWTPVFTGVTTFYEAVRIDLR
jgi:hypothetical protein